MNQKFLLEEEKGKITYKNNKIQETNNEKDIIEAVTYLKDKFGKTIPHWGLINNSNN